MSDVLEGLGEEDRDRAEESDQPEWVSPMLATLTHDTFSDPGWTYERKLDGVRLLAFRKDGSVRLVSRNRKERNAAWPEIVEALGGGDGPDLVADGEVVAFEGRIASFGRLQERMQVRSEEEARRRAEEVKERQELVVGGWTDPQGERIGLGALLVGYYQDGERRYAGNVGTGFDDDALERLSSKLGSLERKTPPFTAGDEISADGVHWATPKLVSEVGFTEWSGRGKLRPPRFVGLRYDKEPEDVVRERPGPVPEDAG